jgi:D-xylose transport system substrate-binding protein
MMKNWKWIVGGIFLLVLGGFFIRYFQNPEIPLPSGEEEGYTIGLSFDSLVVERWQRDMETFVSYANEKQINVNVQIANDDVELQKKQIKELIQAKVDLLVILPSKFDAFVEELRLAEREGIKVIAYDRLLTGGEIDLYLSFDDKKIGENLANEVLEGIGQTADGKKKIVIINGDPDDFNSKLINEGIKNRFDQSDSIEVVAEVWADGWRESRAFDIIEKVLNEGNRIDGIVAANDTLATGAIQALAERSLAGKVVVVGQDAELSACQRIIEGTQRATIYKPINAMSRAAVDYGLLLMKDQAFDYQESIDNDYQSNVVPYVKLETIVVDQENMDEVIIESGFHDRQSVYINANIE